MKNQKLFIKGLRASYGDDLDKYRLEASESIYMMWWSFLRLSPVLWYARKTGIRPIHSRTAEIIETGGNLFRGYFDDWWDKNSLRLFPEKGGRKEIVGLRFDDLKWHAFSRDALYVEIPLVIPIERILKDFKGILSEHHPGRKVDLATTSVALWPLHTMRYRLEVIKREYWTLLYKLLQPEIAVWRIADRLQISPSLKVRGTDWSANQSAFNKLNSTSGRYLYKAKYTLANAEQGGFPNSSRIEIPADFMPFGKQHHRDFLDSTVGYEKKQSAWHRWLAKNHEGDLIWEIKDRNERYFKNEKSDENDPKFLAFYRGTSDLLP